MVNDIRDIKGRVNLKEIFLTLIVFFIVFAAFVFAAHVITLSSGGSSVNVAEDVGFIYNISVNNSDAGQNANITQVNITLPSGFLFIPGASNGTSAVNPVFTNDSASNQVLSWSNFTNYLVNGSEIKYFWFNATAATPGNYNITVTTLNATGPFMSNISVSVNDTTAPSTITFDSPVEIDGTNLSRSNIQVNVSATDNGVIDKIVIRLYNSTQALINTSISSAGVASYFINFTNLADGTYRFNATVNDSYGNSNSSSGTRSVTLDTTLPVPSFGNGTENNGVNVSRNWIYANVSVVETNEANITFLLFNSTSSYNVTTFTTAVRTINWTGLVDGTYTYNVTVRDYANNANTTETRTIKLDNVNPSISIVSPTANQNLSSRTITINATATDATTGLNYINLTIYNSTAGIVNSTTTTTSGTNTLLTVGGDGAYSVNATSYDYISGHSNTTGVSVNVDAASPVINLISPTNGNTSVPTSITFTYNVTDTTLTNCSLVLNGGIINFNSSVNITGGSNSFTNFSFSPVSNTWGINCTDSANNQVNSTTLSFSLSSFELNGSVKDENSIAVNNSVVNITIRSESNWAVVGYTSGTSNASGWFNFSIASNSSWFYEPSIMHRNGSVVDFRSKSLPALPSSEITNLAGTTYYLTPAGTINITAINATGGRVPFQYQVKDSKLGYPIAEEHTNWFSEVNVYVPRNRNYSIMIYPNQSMPISFNWNNYSSNASYSFTPGSSSYNATTYTLHKQFNISLTLVRVTGYINYSGINGWNNFTVIPYLLEPGNMVHSEYGDMPYNISSALQQSDLYNLTSGFYNISLPGTAETSSMLLFAASINGSSYYGGFRNISLGYGDAPTNQFNFSLSGLMGSAGNITLDRIDGVQGQNIAIPTARLTINIVNSTNSTLTSTSVHAETRVDYSSLGAIQFTWMSDVPQSQTSANFAIPLLNSTGIKEMNVYVSGGSSQYAPKRVPTKTAAEIIANSNITVRPFNPGDIDGALSSGNISIALYISNSSCDIPSPASSCVLGSSSQTMSDFNPMQAVMGGGKISFRMGTSGGILVHYVNVDMLASGPPDALFENDAGTSESSSSFQNAIKFGSQGPTIYDYVLISMPYTEGSSSTTGLNESGDVNMSIPTFYDDNWNAIWSASNGTNASALAGNYSHYSTYQSDWQVLMQQNNCSTSVILNATTPCYINKIDNRIWVRLPHFSGTGPTITGNIITAAAAATTTDTSSGPGGETGFWKGTTAYDTKDFSQKQPLTKEYLKGYRARIKLGNEIHYMGVISLTDTSATINVSSTPQQATLAIGESKKFEISGDSFYDMLVKLEGIKNNKANITMSYIHEQIPQTPANGTTIPPANNTGETTPPDNAPASNESGTKSRTWIWVTALIIVLVVVAAVFIAYYSYFRKQGYKYHHNTHSFYA